MARRDKYARASALSKIFEEMVQREGGDKQAAKKRMDSELGPEWQLEIVIEDEIGPEFIDPDLLDDDVSGSTDDRDDMFKLARQYSADFVRPGDDLEYVPSQHGDNQGTGNSKICTLLRELADELEK